MALLKPSPATLLIAIRQNRNAISLQKTDEDQLETHLYSREREACLVVILRMFDSNIANWFEFSNKS